MGILLFFVVLAVLVLSHEFGHFIVAKLSGIRVDEFGFGFPPKLIGINKGETEYTFNLIPFGGFVKIFGEEENEEFVHAGMEEKKRSLTGKSRKIQAAVISAGVIFNLILAWFLISVGFMVGTTIVAGSVSEKYVLTDTHIILTQVFPDTPASSAGLEAGDEIIYLVTDKDALQGENITVENIQNFISVNEGNNIFVGYKRDEKPVAVVSVVPISGIIEGHAAMGISLDKAGFLKLPFLNSLYEGFILTSKITYNMIISLADFFYGFFTGESSLKSVSGPVGLVSIVSDVSKEGIVKLLNLVSLISINLAVLNMVPFPALDGGRLFILLIEGIRRKPLNPKITNTINVFGFFILLGFMFAVTYSDIMKLFF